MVVAALHRPPRPSLNRHPDPLASITQLCHPATSPPTHSTTPTGYRRRAISKLMQSFSVSQGEAHHHNTSARFLDLQFRAPATARPSPPIPALPLALLANWLEVTRPGEYTSRDYTSRDNGHLGTALTYAREIILVEIQAPKASTREPSAPS